MLAQRVMRERYARQRVYGDAFSMILRYYLTSRAPRACSPAENADACRT